MTSARNPTPAHPREPWFHAIRWTVFPLLRVWFRWRFEGLDRIPAQGPAIVACNHASYLDPLANAYAVVRARRRPRFLAKQELFRAPGIKWAVQGTHQIPVARGTSEQRASLTAAEDALARGEVVVVYPEGTVTTREDGLPMEGKTGTVRLALASGVPILPMVSWGSSPVWQKSGRGSLRPGRPVWIRVGEPIDVSRRGVSLEDRDGVATLTAEVMETLTRAVVELRSTYPARWTAR
jgi:1-acyl-sn-glycerol-3-phosphate acyltransferase